jgi:hypothetical protein
VVLSFVVPPPVVPPPVVPPPVVPPPVVPPPVAPPEGGGGGAVETLFIALLQFAETGDPFKCAFEKSFTHWAIFTWQGLGFVPGRRDESPFKAFEHSFDAQNILIVPTVAPAGKLANSFTRPAHPGRVVFEESDRHALPYLVTL